MGDDWRASRDVAASGTITHDGESDVLVSFIHENGDETELIWILPPLHTIVPCVPERRGWILRSKRRKESACPESRQYKFKIFSLRK